MSTNNLEVGLNTGRYLYANPNNSDIEAKNAKDGTGDFINLSGAGPLQPQHYVTKQYMDGALAGVTADIICQAASTADIEDLTVGLTNGDNLDGVLLATGYYILIKNEIDQTQNGVYTVMESGSPCRIPAEDLADGVIVEIAQGDTNQGTYWVSNGSYTGGGDTYPVYDVDNITFGQTSIYPDALVSPKIYVNSDSDPNSGDDVTAGYKDGDIWIDQDAETGFLCVDSSEGDAVWISMSGSSSGSFGAVQWSNGYGASEADNNFYYDPDNGNLQVPISLTTLYAQAFYQTEDGSLYMGTGTGDGWQNELTGGQNTVIGYQAYNNSGGSGTNNTVVGYQAFENNDNGGCNTIVGNLAGQAIESGYYNTILGFDALSSSSSGYANIAIGAYAMSDSDVDGYDNIAIGYYAAEELSSGNYNINIGGYNGQNNSGGANNISLGYRAFYTSETSNSNVAIGSNSLYNINTADGGNIAIGESTINQLWDSSYNIAIGYHAMSTGNGSCLYNIAIGYQALLAIAGGSGNIALGTNTLATSVNDSGNIGIGNGALTILNGGSNNIGIGDSTLVSSTADSSNIAIGNSALYTLNGGGNNVAVGCNASYALPEGSDNTALGNYANELMTSGSQNLAVGCYAGNSFSSGDNNVLIGYNAAPSLVNGSNNIVIGSGYDVNNETDNQINIGGVFTADVSGGAVITTDLSVSGNFKLSEEFWTSVNVGTGGTPGTCVDQMPIYGATGTLLGFIPIYNSIS